MFSNRQAKRADHPQDGLRGGTTMLHSVQGQSSLGYDPSLPQVEGFRAADRPVLPPQALPGRSMRGQGDLGRKTRAKLVCILRVSGCLPMFPSNTHILIFILEVFVRFIANERVSRQKQNDICCAARTVSKSNLKSTPTVVRFSG